MELTLQGGAVFDGQAPKLTDHRDTSNVSNVIGTNMSWSAFDPAKGHIEQSILSYDLGDGYNLVHAKNVILTDNDTTDAWLAADQNSTISNTGIKKRDDGDTWYTTYCKYAWDTIRVEVTTFFYNIKDNPVSFIANLTTAATNIATMIKNGSQKNSCGSSDVYLLTKDDGGKWEVAWSSWTTGQNCDTTAQWNEISFALRNCINDSEYEHKMALCVRMNHGGTWHADVRVQRNWEKAYSNIWDMPCGKAQQSIVVDDGTCKTDYAKDL
ncbi:hypothetical protein KAFR_0I02950 [Kazachstania africana CBS 2517]|uniref:Secreted protein CSS2 C-terminal domain-containing protein n=1 Tax=Kazachstania africana (strain ATCC 22294 / BCRC 22015 / CBS 2517 / CECT 1963 / NBRC 1671 / NRRL Y-8276) TaxID=1071382 RepID=H2B0C4_KAZAF|nr:hypothetical protein KAFR_0I02950 [Kazachstania africana CBS 2517]CCF60074.1 hypothetical protein KAFR_0I02950 [Kazachstania africana CBS 2517]